MKRRLCKLGGHAVLIPLAGLLCVPRAAAAQSAFEQGADFPVYALALQADGAIVVGGFFRHLGGAARSHIGRINPDGSLDTTFNPGAGGQVNTLAVQPDGKIVMGGQFGTLGGASHNNIGRLNADGSLDAGFGADADFIVDVLALQTDGKILVGGSFSNLDETARPNLGRSVAVDELLTGVDIALGNLPLGQCVLFNCAGSGRVTVDCLLKAVVTAVDNCR